MFDRLRSALPDGLLDTVADLVLPTLIFAVMWALYLAQWGELSEATFKAVTEQLAPTSLYLFLMVLSFLFAAILFSNYKSEPQNPSTLARLLLIKPVEYIRALSGLLASAIIAIGLVALFVRDLRSLAAVAIPLGLAFGWVMNRFCAWLTDITQFCAREREDQDRKVATFATFVLGVVLLLMWAWVVPDLLKPQ